jgi:hypothetical protein
VSHPAREKPLTRAEAAGVLARLKADGLVKPMPAGAMTTRRAPVPEGQPIVREPISNQSLAPTSRPLDEIPPGYLELAKRALNDALRDKTRDVATIAARFERLCAAEGKPYDADLTRRAVAAAIAARDRALDAFAAQVRATARSASARRAAPAKATPNVARAHTD